MKQKGRLCVGSLTRVSGVVLLKRFIVLSFAFLAFAFYELSGGAEFDPAAIRTAKAEAAAAAEAERRMAEARVETERPAPIARRAEVTRTEAETGDVTRVALNLTSLSDAGQAESFATPAVASTATETPVIEAQPAALERTVPVSAGSVSASIDTPVILPSLIMPNDTGAAVQQAMLQQDVYDVRRVTGNRVNVRGGPSTGFDVVNQLVRGDEVEILEDNGDGWVRLRPVTGGPEGWMADFLLSGG